MHGAERIRVLITAEVLANAFTGVEHYTVQLARALARRPELEVTVLCSQPIDAQVLGKDVRCEIAAPPARMGIVGYWLRPPKCLRRFDVVHCPTVRTPFLLAPRGAKLVMTVHDLIPLVTPEHHSLHYRVYFRHVLPRLLQQCDAVITDSESTQRDLQREFPRLSCSATVVACGPRWQNGSDESKVAPQLREKFFLAVGTLEPRKNLERVVAAFVQFQQAGGAAYRLKVVGRIGWGVGRLQKLLEEHRDQIDVLGYVSEEELQSLYRRATALIYPSLYEGFGLPVLEAMSLGCPVITSDRSSLPEVAGDAAWMVNPEQVDSIANAISAIAGDVQLREKLSVAGLARARLFSWERCAEETASVYRAVLGATPQVHAGSRA